ncbi:MAG: Crp/Fnr family transcriptional regulator [Clostridiales bacterium]|nr:Crp/Fnr family transcriptional regulator [Clostridiales bacterium]
MECIPIKERKKFISALKKNFLFIGTGNIIVSVVMGDDRAEWLAYKKGEVIYDYDNYKKSLGIILKGRVSVKKNKNGSVLLNTLKAGEAFGGAAIFSKTEAFIAKVKAESECYMLFIPEELLRELMILSPELNMNYVEYLADSLVFLNKRLDIFAAGGAEERTAEFLRRNSNIDENGKRIIDGLSMTKTAEYLAIGRATLYRILDNFESEGIITRNGRKIYIEKEL